jgi:hypothetical protein
MYGMMDYGYGGGYGGMGGMGGGGMGGGQQSMQMMSSSVSAILMSLVLCLVAGFLMYQNGMFDADEEEEKSPPSTTPNEELEALKAQNAKLIEGNTSTATLAGNGKMFLATRGKSNTHVYLTNEVGQGSNNGKVFFVEDFTNSTSTVKKDDRQVWDIEGLPTQLVENTSGKIWPLYRIKSHIKGQAGASLYLTYMCQKDNDNTPSDVTTEPLKALNSGEGTQEWLIDTTAGYVLIPRQCHSGESKNALRSNLITSGGCTAGGSCPAQVGRVLEPNDAETMVTFEQFEDIPSVTN